MIRQIQKCEIEKCVELIQKSFLTVAQEFGFTRENAPRFTAFATTAERLEYQYEEGRPMYGYFDAEGQILGYYSLHLQENGECELNNLCVLPEYRHRGIGEILFCHAMSTARALDTADMPGTAAGRGIRKINIGIVEENKKLRVWYERMGARHVGTKKFDFFPFTCGYMEADVDREKLPQRLQDIEFWDAYHEDGSMAGCDLIRGEEIPKGLRHGVAEVFVIHEDGTILLMQRDFTKPNYPGLWESGAGGSILKGELPDLGAERELLEETGIAGNGALKSLYHMVTDTTIYWGYLCETSIPKDQVKLQRGETIAFRWVSRRQFLEIFYSERFVDKLRERLTDYVERDLRGLNLPKSEA